MAFLATSAVRSGPDGAADGAVSITYTGSSPSDGVRSNHLPSFSCGVGRRAVPRECGNVLAGLRQRHLACFDFTVILRGSPQDGVHPVIIETWPLIDEVPAFRAPVLVPPQRLDEALVRELAEFRCRVGDPVGERGAFMRQRAKTVDNVASRGLAPGCGLPLPAV